VTGVPENDMENVADLVEVGEWEVALENLCTQLYEYGALVPEETLRRIEALGHELGVADRYWKRLASSGR